MNRRAPGLTAAYLYIARSFLVIVLHGIAGGCCSCQPWRDRRYRETGDERLKGPCPTPGKHPRVTDWRSAATRDEKVVAEWFGRWPDSNLGIVTGRDSDVVVLDADPRHGGDESLPDLRVAHRLPETLQAVTGGGGAHLYYKHPGGVIQNSAGAIAPGIDLRGDGGLVVAPPSLHISGRKYAWDGLAGYKAPIERMPDSLIALLRGRRRIPASRSHVGPEVIPVGKRNEYATSLAGAIRNKGGTKNVILGALREVAFEEPLSEAELNQIATSICRYPPGSITFDEPPAASRKGGR